MAKKTTGLGGLADRYAAALFDLADAEKALDAVAADLDSISRLIAESSDLRRVIHSPAIARADQMRAIGAIAEKAEMNELTKRFLGVLARNNRLFMAEAVIRAYQALLAARRGEVTAEVTAADSLSDVQMGAVTEALRKALGANVTVDMKIDPGIVGGLVVRVGSRMVDGSLRSKLQRLQLAMKGIG